MKTYTLIFFFILIIISSAAADDINWLFGARTGGSIIREYSAADIYDRDTHLTAGIFVEKPLFLNIYAAGSVGYINSRGIIKYNPDNEMTLVTENYHYDLFPIHLGLGYKFIFVKDQLVVPNLYGGLDYYIAINYDQYYQSQKPLMLGFHFGVRVDLPLNRFDETAAQNIRRQWNVKETYLSIGVNYSKFGMDQFLSFNYSGLQMMVSVLLGI